MFLYILYLIVIFFICILFITLFLLDDAEAKRTEKEYKLEVEWRKKFRDKFQK